MVRYVNKRCPLVGRSLLPMVLLFLACGVVASDLAGTENPPNIIFVIGDGMGPAYTSAYRLYKDDIKSPGLEPTIFDDLHVGMAKTYSIRKELSLLQKESITDSAAAATALATGFKTVNGYIGVDSDKNDLTTTLEQAKLQGYLTGMITTSTITHATPASFVANHYNRNHEDVIARHYLHKNKNDDLKFDLLIGGGRELFIQSERNLIDELVAAGFEDVKNKGQLSKVLHPPIVALLENGPLDYAINSQDGLRLTHMTEQALRLLKDKPFFLMVEGSQIDWCGHGNDIACAMREMEDFTSAVELLKKFVDKNPNTLLVVTADHETGGLGVSDTGAGIDNGAQWKERWRPDVVRGVKGSTYAIQSALYKSGSDWQKAWNYYTNIELGDDRHLCVDGDANTIDKELTDKQCIDVLVQESCHYSYENCSLGDKVNHIINRYSNTHWNTTDHTGVDVQIFAYGKYSELFEGDMDNTDIAKKVFSVLRQSN